MKPVTTILEILFLLSGVKAGCEYWDPEVGYYDELFGATFLTIPYIPGIQLHEWREIYFKFVDDDSSIRFFIYHMQSAGKSSKTVSLIKLF